MGSVVRSIGMCKKPSVRHKRKNVFGYLPKGEQETLGESGCSAPMSGPYAEAHSALGPLS